MKLYGDAAKWFFEVGVHDATPERLRWIRTLACRAFRTAAGGPAGPVHLNFPLREPLITEEPLPDDDSGRAGGVPYVITEPPHSPAPAGGAGPHPSGRILIVAGASMQDPAGVASYAQAQAIPLLADPLSGARRGDAAIAHYDLLLRNQSFTDAHRPDYVFRLGDLPTSKPLRAWLARLRDVPQIAFDPDGTWQDPDAVVGMRLWRTLPRPDELDVESGWLDSWRSADARSAQAIDSTLAIGGLSEPLVARTLAAGLPADAILYVASSMPIRDIETFVSARPDPPRVIANRGANGIDGSVSSAFGAAAASTGRVVLLTGDLALLHDIGGLLASRRLDLDLSIVVLNNDGGGIFHFLPVATQQDAFEQHVATPHGLDLATAAELFGCTHALAETERELQRAVNDTTGTTIIEVRTDREANLALHRQVAEAAAGALSRPAAAAAPPA